MKKSKRKLLYLIGFVLLLLNIIACFHAYKFTHFDETITQKPKDPKDLVFTEKLKRHAHNLLFIQIKLGWFVTFN